ncbi:MAG: hypothetical protein M1830_010406, partial [Pleopsidium flavum]
MAPSRSTPHTPGSHEGYRNTSRNSQGHQHVKASATAHDAEDAPLLVNNDDEEDVEAQDDGDIVLGQSKRDKLRVFSRRCFQWALENIMFVIVACLLAAGTVALCVYFGVIYSRKSTSKPASICLTPTCIHAASEILYNLSPNHRDIDPCINFDEFVCGGWQERHDLRSDQGDVFTGTLMQEQSQLLLRHVLESPYSNKQTQSASEPSVDEDNFNKLQDAYRACMDEDTIKDAGARPLINILRKVEEIFPARRPQPDETADPTMLNQLQKRSMLQDKDQLSNVVLYLMKIGVGALVDLSVGADDMDPDKVVTSVTAPRRVGLPSKEYYKNKEVLSKYARTIGEVLEALLQEAEHNLTSKMPLESLGHARFATRREELVHAIVNLETKIAEASPDEEDALDVTKYYNPRTLAETESLLPQLSFSYMFSNLAPPDSRPNRLIINTPAYLESLSNTLRETSRETLQAYLVWKAVQTHATRIEHNAVKPLIRFENELQGKGPDASEERWRKCIKEVDQDLGWILSRFFVGKAFSKQARDFGDRIVSDIKHQFAQKLKATKWMTKDVRKLGIEKVKNIVQKIGYPTKSPDIMDPAALRGYYKGVNISRSEFFENALSAATFDTEREFGALGKPTDRDEWGMTVPTVNAYYNPAGNEIVFPAGIMQSPVFYEPTVPQYLSYGAFGAVSGHELSHAFDSTGRHYDQNGNYTDWWNNQTVRAFTEKAECFVDQYAKFTVPGPDDKPLHVNGRLTLGENIADAGGLTASFAAWKQREKANPGKLLPGLQNFTKEQLFFISYSNWWCGKSRKEAAINRIYLDPHAPKWARIL